MLHLRASRVERHDAAHLRAHEGRDGGGIDDPPTGIPVADRQHRGRPGTGCGRLRDYVEGEEAVAELHDTEGDGDEQGDDDAQLRERLPLLPLLRPLLARQPRGLASLDLRLHGPSEGDPHTVALRRFRHGSTNGCDMTR